MRIPRLKLGLTVLGSAAVLAAGATAGIALGSPSRTAGQSPVQQALAKTAKVASGHFSFTFSMTGGGSSGAISLAGTGGFDTKQQASQFKLDLGPLAGLLGATGGSVPQVVDVVTIKQVAYLHIPSLAKQLSPGKEWLKIDAKTLSKGTKGAAPPTKVDPQKTMAAITSSVAVHKVGSATVRGVSTTHYHLTVNTTKAIGALPKSQQKSVKIAAKTVPVDVYVDGSGYVRRVAVDLTNVKLQQGSPAVSIKLSVDLYDFGAAVHASAPPASKTVDAGSLIGQLVGAVGG